AKSGRLPPGPLLRMISPTPSDQPLPTQALPASEEYVSASLGSIPSFPGGSAMGMANDTEPLRRFVWKLWLYAPRAAPGCVAPVSASPFPSERAVARATPLLENTATATRHQKAAFHTTGRGREIPSLRGPGHTFGAA